MAIVLSVLGATFGAFGVWLAVRIINRRERWAMRTLTAVVVLPLLYFASFGPACWLTSRTKSGASALPIIYRPLMWGMAQNDKVYGLLNSYAELEAAQGWHWVDKSDSRIRSNSFVWMSLNSMPRAGGGVF